MSTSTAHPPLGVPVVHNDNAILPPHLTSCPTAVCDSHVPSSTLTSTMTFPSYTSLPLNTSRPRPEELFTFNSPMPDPYACGNATFAWSYSGESQFFSILLSPADAPSANLTGFTKRATSDVTIARDVLTTDGSWTWLPVDVQQGWYKLTAVGDTWLDTSQPFLVIDGPNVDCLSNPSGPTSSSLVISSTLASSVPSPSFSSSSFSISSILSSSSSSQLPTSTTALASSTTTSTSSSALSGASTHATASDASTTSNRLNVGVIVGILGGAIGVALLAVIVYPPQTTLLVLQAAM
ncbi:hypothetical protein C8Q74DRAFT_1052027 [Fomes fomentarius]|nr:hypothetical protein C8Q74DRAFT_1052027 [Fomes fomentarius]